MDRVTITKCVPANGGPALTGRRQCGGVRAMTADEHAFSGLVEAVLRRFLAQNGVPAADAAMSRGIAVRLWALVRERGLPRPLATHERGEPGGMSEAECAPLVARVLGEVGEPVFQEAAKQLVKACFYPEFKTCRDSFRAVAADGSCRRQELARVRQRISGAHCVDCPHWVALDPEQHARFLARNWKAGADAFAAHRDTFLPEDFRRLRRWLHDAARRPIQ